MCKIGDILLIYNAKNKRKPVGMHPFLVLDDTDGIVRGIYKFDFIGLLLTSAETEERKEKLKQFDGNFPISEDDKIMDEGREGDNKYSFVEADQFFYFDKERIKYVHLGTIEPNIYNLIIEFIEEISDDGVSIKQILDKATRIESVEEPA